MTRRRLFVAPLLVSAALGVTACGVPTQEHPEIVKRHEVPFGLTEHEPPVAPSSTTIPVTPDRNTQR
jgi:hypothetical protein